MAQKNKVKELVGRGLDSYHTKALQQIERIEKKNKEQNHKISILSNELDNDYLTKTEEGSVVSLEHSKEGMVYLDELQGNTLVNYCTDGSKELTLNGDIDVEGTFVTFTEGVDNGLVDVMCEGNTLVNLKTLEPNLSQIQTFTDCTITDKGEYFEVVKGTNQIKIAFDGLDPKLFKSNTTYTLVNLKNDGYTRYLVYDLKSDRTIGSSKGNTDRFIFTTPNEFTKFRIYFDATDSGHTSFKYYKNSLIILEGDWTNKEIPPYFEGMKSVGQDDENGHKIEILSNNGNLWNGEFEIGSLDVNNGTENDNGTNRKRTSYIEIMPNKQCSFKINDFVQVSGTDNYNVNIHFYDSNKQAILNSQGKANYYYISNGNIFTFTTPTNAKYVRMRTEDNRTLTPLSLTLTYGTTVIATQGKSNKKEILINEPLRKLPNGVCDKFKKIGNKWYIERNCGVFNINDILSNVTDCIDKVNGKSRLIIKVENLPNFKPYTSANSLATNIYSDKYCIYASVPYLSNGDNIGIGLSSSTLSIKDIGTTMEEVKNSVREKNAKLLYQLTTPIYEPLEVEPTLNTYNDITHISNNSIIPCNMKIQNTGYNAIIKPSTLYTVALDTNKSGTIGMNLGGAKVATTNNVATITTPATLADDSLRLYGKGINASKVRLLEGDKTNWIPSHFEGMKSSFEDKLQDDGTYKMEILSNNKNLFNSLKEPDYTGGDMRYYSGYGGLFKRIENKEYILGNYGGMAFILNLPKNKTYKISIKVRNSNGSNTKVQSAIFLNKEMIGHTKSTFTTNVTENVIGFGVVNYNEDTDLILYDVILSEVIDEYTERKSNKIQFSSIEPLRGVGDVKDRFVFKDGKLMIERFYKQIIFDGSENWIYKEDDIDGYIYNCDIPDLKLYGINSIKQGLMDKFGMRGHTNFCAFFEYVGGKNINIKLPYAMTSPNKESIKQWISENNIKLVYELENPVYEEIPFELQKIILEGYENGTLFFDTNIPPTSTVTYAGETPIVKATKLNKTEVLSNTEDINDNIIPYLMDMDYRVVMLQLATEELEGGVSMARLFGGTYEMIKRDILSKRLTREEYGYRLADYYNVGKLTEEQVRELEELR